MSQLLNPIKNCNSNIKYYLNLKAYIKSLLKNYQCRNTPKTYLMFKAELYSIKCTIIFFSYRIRFFFTSSDIILWSYNSSVTKQQFQLFFYYRHLYKFSMYIQSDRTLPSIIFGCKCIAFSLRKPFPLTSWIYLFANQFIKETHPVPWNKFHFVVDSSQHDDVVKILIFYSSICTQMFGKVSQLLFQCHDKTPW